MVCCSPSIDWFAVSADSLTVESLLELLDEESLRKDTALPSPEWSSDHIALLAEFRCKSRPRRWHRQVGVDHLLLDSMSFSFFAWLLNCKSFQAKNIENDCCVMYICVGKRHVIQNMNAIFYFSFLLWINKSQFWHSLSMFVCLHFVYAVVLIFILKCL